MTDQPTNEGGMPLEEAQRIRAEMNDRDPQPGYMGALLMEASRCELAGEGEEDPELAELLRLKAEAFLAVHAHIERQQEKRKAEQKRNPEVASPQGVVYPVGTTSNQMEALRDHRRPPCRTPNHLLTDPFGAAKRLAGRVERDVSDLLRRAAATIDPEGTIR